VGHFELHPWLLSMLVAVGKSSGGYGVKGHMLDSPTMIRTARLAAALGAFALVLLLLEVFAPSWLDRARRLLSSTRLLVVVSLSLLAIFAGLLLVITTFPGYLDQAEPNITLVAWLVRRGAPLYHSFDSADRYSLLYGPGAYLPYTAALWLGGAATLSVRCVVLLSNLVMLYFLWRTARSLFDAPRALVMLWLVLLFILVPRPNNYLFQVRADILLMTAIAVALFGATRRSGIAAPVALALSTAFIIDTKATAVIYALPLFALLVQRRGLRLTLGIGLATLAVAGLPFLLPNVSLSQYAQWLRRATGHPSTMADLNSTLRTLPILFAPLFLILGPTPWREPKLIAWLRQNLLVLLALVPCLALAVLASSRIGAGSHHLLPFVPLLGYLYAELGQASGWYFLKTWPRLSFYVTSCLTVVVLTRVVGGLMEVSPTWRSWHEAIAIRSELRSVLVRFGPGKVGMGSGDTTSQLTYFRPELVFAGQKFVLDDVALSDMMMDGMPIPAATVAALANCTTPVWLIPRGQQPFMVPSLFAGYDPSLVGPEPMFSPAFREAFSSRYQKAESTTNFDVWICASKLNN
jgi:hypothetical protein